MPSGTPDVARMTITLFSIAARLGKDVHVTHAWGEITPFPRRRPRRRRRRSTRYAAAQLRVAADVGIASLSPRSLTAVRWTDSGFARMGLREIAALRRRAAGDLQRGGQLARLIVLGYQQARAVLAIATGYA